MKYGNPKEEHQMTTSFTTNQAIHAHQVVLSLLLQRRFFIDHEASDFYTKKGFRYIFDENLFQQVLVVQSRLNDIYVSARKKAETFILEGEKSLGFSEPQVPKNRTIVQCNRYTGGFDIKSVFPFSFFLDMDLSFKEVEKNILDTEMKGKTENDISPKEMEKLKSNSNKIAKKVLEQLDELKKQDNFENLCVVLMESRFSLEGGYKEDDFTEGCLDGIDKYPELLGYLFYQKSENTRFVPHNYIMFNTSRKSHVHFGHWSDGGRLISYDVSDGYTCRSHFATII